MSAPPFPAPKRGLLAARDGQQLYYESWTPPDSRHGAVVLVHGYGEHCGRSEHVVQSFIENGLETWRFDYRGHRDQRQLHLPVDDN
jgi:alpha-beta hydrolase superfamily lysophospholipase